MSVSSSNVATTWDRPNFDIERTLIRPEKPDMDSSIGSVICCSISVGLRLDATVFI